MKLPKKAAPNHNRASALPTPGSTGRGSATPSSLRVMSVGAWVRWASAAASSGMPSPTTATSPSFSSRAPATTISSAVENSVAMQWVRLQRDQPRQADALQVLHMAGDAEDITIKIRLVGVRLAGSVDVGAQLVGVVVVAAIEGGGVRSVGQRDHRRDAEAGHGGQLRLLTDDLRRHELLGDDDGLAGGAGGFLGVPQRAQHAGVAVLRSEEHTSELQSPVHLVC